MSLAWRWRRSSSQRQRRRWRIFNVSPLGAVRLMLELEKSLRAFNVVEEKRKRAENY